jgi:hypothetical protein
MGNSVADPRIRARDEAMRMVNRISAGVAIGAVAGVGLFGIVSAETIPGVSSSSSNATASADTSTSTASASTSDSLQPSSGSVSSSTGPGLAVSGGSS